MNIQGLLALRSGEVLLPDGQPATLEVHERGRLRVPSGRLAVCDPIRLETPGVIRVPPGNHPVTVTLARVPESYDLAETRPAYLSLVISGQQSVSVHPAAFEDSAVARGQQVVGPLRDVPGLYGVATTDISSVAMVDAEAIRPGMPSDPGTWYDTVISPPDSPGWFGRMDTEVDGPRGSVLAELPAAAGGENIAILIARPERLFPVLETRDAAGAITGIHIDLLVIGELSEKLGAFDGRCEDAAAFAAEADEAERRRAAADSRGQRGLLARLRDLFRR